MLCGFLDEYTIWSWVLYWWIISIYGGDHCQFMLLDLRLHGCIVIPSHDPELRCLKRLINLPLLSLLACNVARRFWNNQPAKEDYFTAHHCVKCYVVIVLMRDTLLRWSLLIMDLYSASKTSSYSNFVVRASNLCSNCDRHIFAKQN